MMGRLRDIWTIVGLISYLLVLLITIVAGMLWWLVKRTWAQMGVQRNG